MDTSSQDTRPAGQPTKGVARSAAPQASLRLRPTAALGALEFDLHGIVGVRVLDAGPHEAAVVRRQLGPMERQLARAPDIVLRFVERLPQEGEQRLLGVHEAGFTEAGFFVLRGKQKTRTCVQVPLERVGGPCELVAERGLAAVPLLAAIVNLTALAKGYLPLHACAFEHRGKGVLCMGWSKGGKTETLLAFMAEGATYIGDEWVWLDAGGSCMWGFPEPIHLWRWHLSSLPSYRAAIRRAKRVKLALLDAAAGGVALWQRLVPRRLRLPARVHDLLQRQLHVEVPPQALFSPARCTLTGTPDVLVLVGLHGSPAVACTPIDAGEIAARMRFSLLEEFSSLRSWYHRFRFAFPERANAVLDSLEERLDAALGRALRGKPAFALDHPYPLALPRLFAALAPRVAPAEKGTAPAARRSVTVALVGADGAGKTAIARLLDRDRALGCKHVYMGINPAAATHALPHARLWWWLRCRLRRAGQGTAAEPRHAASPPSLLRRVKGGLRLLHLLVLECYLHAVVALLRLRGRAVVCDRHFFLDYHAHDVAARARPLSRRIHGFFLARVFPRPDLCILLDAPAEVLFARKPEGSVEQIERRRQEYLALRQALPRFAVVDAGRPLEAVLRDVVAHIAAFRRGDEI